jgi:hypothetical protein
MCLHFHRQRGRLIVELGTKSGTREDRFPIMLHLPANVVSKGRSVTNTTRQHFLFFEMTYSVGNRLCEQKMRPTAHHLHFKVLRAIRDPSARHRRPFSTYPGTGQRLASNCCCLSCRFFHGVLSTAAVTGSLNAGRQGGFYHCQALQNPVLA